jgi:hypothetical protein
MVDDHKDGGIHRPVDQKGKEAHLGPRLWQIISDIRRLSFFRLTGCSHDCSGRRGHHKCVTPGRCCKAAVCARRQRH